MNYYMTGPDGDRHAGYWLISTVQKPTVLSFEDGFADLDFNPIPDMAVFRTTTPSPSARATYVSTYATAEGLQQVLDMGVIEGVTAVINQIDELVAE